jgi:excisionase family DNA binding protein
MPGGKRPGETRGMLPRLLTLREVANYLHVHPGTVYRLVKNGELRQLRVGRHFRFEIKVLEDFVGKGGSAHFDSEKDR